MARVNTNWDEVHQLISSSIKDMETVPKLLSDIKSKINNSKIPTVTKGKLNKYLEFGISNGAFVETDRIGWYTINSISDNFFKAKTIQSFCKTGKITQSNTIKEEPKVEIIFKDESIKYPLKSKVYFVENNKFIQGVVVGVLFIDTEKEEGLSYLVKYRTDLGESTTKQFFESDIFKSIADCANSMIREFNKRNPDYGKINR